MTETAEKTYTFSELSDEAKEKACEDFRSPGESLCDADVLREEFEFLLKEEYGMEGMQIYWSLGCCQGDGVAFEGSPDIDSMAAHDPVLKQLLEQFNVMQAMRGEDVSCVSDGLTFKIKHQGRYSHCNSMDITLWFEHGDSDVHSSSCCCCDFEDQLVAYIKDRVRDISQRLETAGYAMIESMDSDEYIGEFLEANEFQFDEEGNEI